VSARLPSRFELLAAELAERAAPALVERVAELIAERFGEVPPLLTAEGAARYLGVDAETVRRMARRGSIPVIRVGGGTRPRLRFDPEELCRALSQPMDMTVSGRIGGDLSNGASRSQAAATVGPNPDDD
jgi:excisionase family DNA binding protein